MTARDKAYLFLSRNYIVNTNVFLIRTEIFRNIGHFNRNFAYGEDCDMWIRISEQYKGLFADHFGAVYRTNHGVGEQQSSDPAAGIRNARCKFIFQRWNAANRAAYGMNTVSSHLWFISREFSFAANSGYIILSN